MLIVAPPTDFFLEHLLRFNGRGENHLLLFSEKMAARAVKRLAHRHSCQLRIGRPDALPYEDETFQAVFAYCYFDYLDSQAREAAAAETKRVMCPAGRLLTTFLGHPRGPFQRLSTAAIVSLEVLSRGVQQIELAPVLRRAGFRRIELVSCAQGGLPIELAYAEA